MTNISDQKPIGRRKSTWLYFAYGSNMNTAQMQERCKTGFKIVGPARLENYEFGFDSSGYANVIPKQGKFVWGLVWKINTACVDILDEYEGYPDVYGRKEVPVEYNGNRVKALVYIESEEEFNGVPNKDYLNNKIIIGAKENGIPKEWIDNLESFRQLV